MLLGGVCRAASTADGGFEVLALLPLGTALADAEYGAPWDVLREKVDA
ncbi:MAG: hypothetical protein ACK5IM_06115 [Demequina sp.]